MRPQTMASRMWQIIQYSPDAVINIHKCKRVAIYTTKHSLRARLHTHIQTLQVWYLTGRHLYSHFKISTGTSLMWEGLSEFDRIRRIIFVWSIWLFEIQDVPNATNSFQTQRRRIRLSLFRLVLQFRSADWCILFVDVCYRISLFSLIFLLYIVLKSFRILSLFGYFYWFLQ